MTNQNQTQNYTFALIVVFIVCFLIGFITTMNNSMIDFCSKAFNLSAQEGQYVNSAFYGAYLLAIDWLQGYTYSRSGRSRYRLRYQFIGHRMGYRRQCQRLRFLPEFDVLGGYGCCNASERG